MNAELKQPNIEDFADLSPVELTDIRKVLRSSEMLVVAVSTDNKNYLIAIDKSDVKFWATTISKVELENKIAKLRVGLDPLETDMSSSESFDTELAHGIYKELFGEIGSFLNRNKLVNVVSSGPLTSLPLQVLVTSKPNPRQSYRDISWLMKKHAISGVVSVSSLVASRTNRFDFGGGERRAIVGFADPKFNFNNLSIATNIDESRQISGLLRSVDVDVNILSKAAPLPETRDELISIADALSGNRTDLYLGEAANEETIKSLSESGELKGFKVLYFATHGLVAGELDGISEPGLVLSVPSSGSLRNDGLLSSSEISRLKLNADWVVLSACNTAAPNRPGADALSGLAKSFFTAGSRSVLASHWPVVSSAAVKLTTGLFSRLSKSANASRPEALRQTMMKILSESKNVDESHPGYWAPFVLVGNGE